MYRVDIASGDDSSFRVRSQDYEFVVDTKGKGITSPDTLLAALGTCVGVYIRKYVEGAKLAFGEFGITVEADLEKAHPASFRKINISIDLKGAVLDERRKKALLEFVKNCPVHNTLKVNPLVEIKII